MARTSLDLRAGYMDQAYNTGVLRRKAHLDLDGLEFDTVVGTGLSGALVVPRLAEWFDVDFLIIRKPGDGSHSSSEFEGNLGRRWLFVDDFIDTGSTFNNVFCHVSYASEANRWETEFVGAWLYELVGPSLRLPFDLEEELKLYEKHDYRVSSTWGLITPAELPPAKTIHGSLAPLIRKAA